MRRREFTQGLGKIGLSRAISRADAASAASPNRQMIGP